MYVCTIVFIHIRGVGVLALMSYYEFLPHFKHLVLIIFFLSLNILACFNFQQHIWH